MIFFCILGYFSENNLQPKVHGKNNTFTENTYLLRGGSPKITEHENSEDRKFDTKLIFMTKGSGWEVGEKSPQICMKAIMNSP